MVKLYQRKPQSDVFSRLFREEEEERMLAGLLAVVSRRSSLGGRLSVVVSRWSSIGGSLSVVVSRWSSFGGCLLVVVSRCSSPGAVHTRGLPQTDRDFVPKKNAERA